MMGKSKGVSVRGEGSERLGAAGACWCWVLQLCFASGMPRSDPKASKDPNNDFRDEVMQLMQLRKLRLSTGSKKRVNRIYYMCS